MTVHLRSVLFHEVADTTSTFTAGLGVTVPVEQFRARIEFLARWYKPISLDDVRASLRGEPLPRRALLVTIDDAYSSVGRVMAPVLEHYGVPAVFFVNGGFLDHGELGIDNLVAHTFNTVGGAALADAAVELELPHRPMSIRSALQEVVPSISIDQRRRFGEALGSRCAGDPLSVAREEGLYLSSSDLIGLPDSIEVASHTTSHSRCRVLKQPTDIKAEISENRTALTSLTGAPVAAFSVPYGSVADRPARVVEAVRTAGHDLIFLVEGLLNHGELDPDGIFRVSLTRPSRLGLVTELEIEPRARRLRNQIRRRP